VIVCSSLYEYVDNEKLFWTEILRVLNRKGEILLSVPNKSSIVRKIERVVYRHGHLVPNVRALCELVNKAAYLSIQRRQFSEADLLRLTAANGLKIKGITFFGVPFHNVRNQILLRRFATMILVHACRVA